MQINAEQYMLLRPPIAEHSYEICKHAVALVIILNITIISLLFQILARVALVNSDMDLKFSYRTALMKTLNFIN